MTCYFVIESTLTNPIWVPEYMEKVTPLMRQYGGRYLTRSANIEMLEGENAPQFSLIAEFPSKENAKEFYYSDEYAPFKQARQQGSDTKILLVPAEGMA